MRGDEGQALVEFALILPVILLLVVGMLEFARAWNLHQALTDAAREGGPAGGGARRRHGLQDSVRAAVWRGLSHSSATTLATPAVMSGIYDHADRQLRRNPGRTSRSMFACPTASGFCRSGVHHDAIDLHHAH